MGISVDGIISGIDTSGLINDLVSAYSAPKGILQGQIADYELLQETLTGLSSRMSDLSNALEEIQDVSKLRAFSVSYPETDALIADADGDAIAGVYSVEISKLARSEMEVSQGFADSQTLGTIAEGTMNITYGGVTTAVVVDGTNSSLAELAATIDDIDGLTAYVMNTGEAANPYKLVIQGEDTGSDNTIEFDTSGLVGAGTVPAFTEKSTASDAELTINGVDVTSSDNTIDDAIAGLKLELTNTTTSAVDITVSPDTEAIEEKLQTFVDAYNEIISFVSDNSKASDEESGVSAGILNGDSSVRWVMNTLRSKITGMYTSNDLNSLGLLGIQLENDGTLKIDSDTLQEALEENRGSLEDMFTDADGFGAEMIATLDVYIDPVDGTFKERSDSIDSLIEGLNDQVDRWDVRIASYEERLRRGFNSFESLAGSMQTTALFIQSYFFTPES